MCKIQYSTNNFLFPRNQSKTSQTFLIRGYADFYKNRRNTYRANSDVTMYVLNLIKSKEIQIHSPWGDIAYLIEIKKPLCICNIYIPYSTTLLLYDLNQIIQHIPKPFLLLGL